MARRFRFKLQTLLEVRKLREREALRRVARQAALIARLDRLNEQAVGEIARQQAALRTDQERGRLDPLALQRGRAWIAHLRKSIAQRQTQKAAEQETLRRLQDELRAARTAARVIENLRQRRWREYVRDRDRRDQAAADELARQLQGYQNA